MATAFGLNLEVDPHLPSIHADGCGMTEEVREETNPSARGRGL